MLTEDDYKFDEELQDRKFNDRCHGADVKEEIRRMAQADIARAQRMGLTDSPMKQAYDRLMTRIKSDVDRLDDEDANGHIWYSKFETLIKEELHGR